MQKTTRQALLGMLALAGATACSELPTEVSMPAAADWARSFAVAPAGALVDPIVNGSFETGDFTGWVVQPTGAAGQWSVTGPGQGGSAGMGPTAPSDGGFVAWNAFNAAGPATFTLYQDVALPSDDVEVSWRYRAQWTSDYPDNQARTADVQLRDPGTGAVLATLHSFSTGPASVAPTGDTGWLTVSVPFAGVAGQVVRIHVTQSVPDFFPGPGQFEVDAFSMVALSPSNPEPPPTDPTVEDPSDAGSCKAGGWEAFGFKNQGQCVRFVETGKDSR